MKNQANKNTLTTRDEIISALRRELPDLKKQYGIKRIFMFGSFAKGTQRKDSDIDILVETKEPLGLEFVSLSDRLEEILNHKVDVATYSLFKNSFNNPRYRHIAEDIAKDLIDV